MSKINFKFDLSVLILILVFLFIIFEKWRYKKKEPKNYNELIAYFKRLHIISIIMNFVFLTFCFTTSNYQLWMLLLALVLITPSLIAENRKYSFVKKMNKNIESDLNNELNNRIYVSDLFWLTENYVIVFSNYSIFRYDEILMLYKTVQFQTGKGRRNGLHDIIVLITKNRLSVLKLSDYFADDEKEKNDLYELIVSKSKNALIGNTKENNEILLNKYGINKKKLF